MERGQERGQGKGKGGRAWGETARVLRLKKNRFEGEGHRGKDLLAELARGGRQTGGSLGGPLVSSWWVRRTDRKKKGEPIMQRRKPLGEVGGEQAGRQRGGSLLEGRSARISFTDLKLRKKGGFNRDVPLANGLSPCEYITRTLSRLMVARNNWKEEKSQCRT